MPIFPYDDEEERRRRRMLTPGINPKAPSPPAWPPGILPSPVNPDALPDVSAPSPRMLPPPGNPGGMPAPQINRQSRYGELSEARDAYLQKTPGRGKSALSGALQGFLSGGGLAGAASGAIYGATDPRGLQEQQFNRKIRPQIQERFGMEDAEQAARRQAEQDALNNQYRTAQIGELESQAYKNRLPQPAPRPPSPVHSDRGLYDPETSQIIPGTEPLPKEPPKPTPHWVRNDRGDYVDLNAPPAQNQTRKPVRGYDRPRAPKEPKEGKKVISISKVREAHKASGGKMSMSDVKARFIEQGYRIVE